jgi:hypothetical protein
MLEQGHFLLVAACCSYQPHWNRFFRHSCIFSGIKTQKKSQMVLLGTVIIILLGSILPLALNYDKFSSGPQFQSSIYEKWGDFRSSRSSPAIKHISNTRYSSYNYY